MLITIKGEMNSNTIIMVDFNTPLTPMDRSSRQKINKETLALNDTIDQIDVMVIYRQYYIKVAEYTLLSGAHGPFSRIHHIHLESNQPSENLRKLKLYKVSFLTTTL